MRGGRRRSVPVVRAVSSGWSCSADEAADALRYAAGVTVVEACWVAMLALPPGVRPWVWLVLACADLPIVIAGLGPAIPLRRAPYLPKRDGRDKPGHDVG